ncbi:hypothetical protein SM0020_03205 [Sinorhizobium meliloti CCNWSX0020]|uniref:Uncharacterized protein n=1 Tax=Sinorhizobium meliloti CCNWSX0020 TaxID=1107881 RepID=H0FU16_RHIML|nr:hypothetical protein [Sinorhizobium meliloti]EHK79347.1 hypothetical protein SM0020_03205 [Sinorhizobium meliloti CCNWSX0020]RVE85125.1 hypothetical protein CN238_23630 [Sinorhizobium meliloti]RVH24953.1 hypothetical protein CN214_24550 [Sinorhizobium meliloti]
MIICLKKTFAALGVAMVLGAAPAMSAEWTRDTRNGGQITRSVTGDGNVYSGQTTRVGPNGATYTSNSTCRDGLVNRCRRSYSATGPNGRTYSGNTVTARGPHRVRSIGVHTGTRGNVGIGLRRHSR